MKVPLTIAFLMLLVSMLLFSCTTSVDSYTLNLVQLSNETELFHGEALNVQKEIASFPKTNGNEEFLTSAATDRAFQLLKKYPINPPPLKKIEELIRRGVPESANSRLVIKAWRKALVGKVLPYLILCRRLLLSAKKFGWSQNKKTELGNLIVKRARSNFQSPGTLLEVMIDVAEVKAVIEEHSVHSAPDSLEKIAKIQTLGKELSKALNEGLTKKLYLRNFIINRIDLAVDYYPSFLLRRWVDATTEQLRASQQIANQMIIAMTSIPIR